MQTNDTVRRLALFLAAACMILVAIQTAQAEPTMYWSDRGSDTVSRAGLDATNIAVLVSGLGETRGIDIDVEHGYLYWADNGTNKIQRSLLDGANTEDLVTTGLNFPAGVAVDPYNERLYWADATNGKIQRSNLDGSNVVDLITDVTSPYFITLDLIHEQIYWTDQGAGANKIQRANFDGSNIEDLVLGLSTPRGITLDLVNDRMYFADRGTDLIQRANLDGTNVETLVTITRETTDPAPHGVAIDLARGQLYWVDNGKVQIQRSNLDGSNQVNLLAGGTGDLTTPWQIVLDLELERCDFNRSGKCDATDIDLLSAEIAIGTNKAFFDLDRTDAAVNLADHDAWIRLATVQPGDANFDGTVNVMDFDVWSAHRFQENVGWADGDFNGDGFADVSDFNIWNDHAGQLANTVTVPESVTFPWLVLGLVLLGKRCGSSTKRLPII